MRNVVVRRSCASRRNRHRKRNRDYLTYCRVYNLTGLPRSLLRSARRRGWMPGKPIKSRPSSERAPTGSGSGREARCPKRPRTLRTVQYSCQPASQRLCVDRGKFCCRLGASPPEVAEPSFACPEKVHNSSDPAGGATSKRRVARGPAQVGPRGRPASLRPANPASSTTVMTHGERHQAPHAVRRGAHQSLRSRRISGHWDQRGAKFAFGGCRNPQRPDAVMGGCRGGEFQLAPVLPAVVESSGHDRINAI
jgi:hypothetical protein